MKPALLNPYVAKLVGRIKRPTSVRQPQVLLMFATVTGNAKQLATRVRPPSSPHSRDICRMGLHIEVAPGAHIFAGQNT